MIKKTEIQLSKTKLLMALCGSSIFVGSGVLFVMYPAVLNPNFETYPFIIGIVSILFFGTCLIYAIIKMFDRKAGLVIDENGINDNSSRGSIGLINWEDISRITPSEIASSKVILIETTNPGKYINRAKNSISKLAMKFNNKKYGTPLAISSNSLEIEHHELLDKLESNYQKMMNS